MPLTPDQITAIIRAAVPLADQAQVRVERIDNDGRVWCRQRYHESQVRIGGTLSGPSMMALADAAMYAAVLYRLGGGEMAVTQNLNINFLSRPAPRDLLAAAEMIRLGRRSAVLEVRLYSEGARDPVAHVTGIYALPPEGAARSPDDAERNPGSG